MLNRKLITLTIVVIFGIISLEAAPKKKNDAKSSERHLFSFNATDLDGKIIEYRIEILSSGKQKEALRLLVKYMFGDSDSRTRNSYKSKWTNLIKENMSLGCFKHGSSELIGLNLLYKELRPSDSDSESDDEIEHRMTNLEVT